LRVSGDSKKRGKAHRDVTGALHDVSNALTVMLGWLGEARAVGATRESIDDALRIVELRAKAARDLARRAIGAEVPIDEDRAIGDVIGEVIASLAVEAHRARVKLVPKLSAEAARARLSPATDVSQVVTNLLMNAIAFSPRGGEVAVSAMAGDSQVTIDVVDTGPGVTDERRDTIFEGDSMRPGGAGVGLRHARDMARGASGELELLSERGTTGAHFRVTWPRVDAMPPAPRSVPRMKIFEGTHILVVEDDLHVSQLLEAALVARGAQVTIAHTQEELTAALEGGPHDAVLVDLSPIAADPDAAIAALRATSPNATLVVISGSAVELPAPLRQGSVRFVRKPFEVGEIVAVLAAGRTE
jgi:CheY-like chemotaxis protein/anti-sigma regulatory factor (Ser/Thr protein kinase)